jgi:hypothetical protein
MATAAFEDGCPESRAGCTGDLDLPLERLAGLYLCFFLD